jgi:hypothetical protein
MRLWWAIEYVPISCPVSNHSIPECAPTVCLSQVLDMIRNGTFGWADFFQPLVDSLTGTVGGDFYLLGNDFPAYLDAQHKVRRPAACFRLFLVEYHGSL